MSSSGIRLLFGAYKALGGNIKIINMQDWLNAAQKESSLKYYYVYVPLENELGVYMVKKSMDGVNYEYKDGRNILTIKKNLS